MAGVGEPARHVTVVRAGALGDVLLTVPALHNLRARFPAARLDAIGYPSTWGAVGRLVDGAHPIDSALFSSLFTDSVSSALQRWAAGVDLVVAWSSRAPSLSPSVPLIHRSPHPPPGVHAAAWLAGSLGKEVHPPLPEPLLSYSGEEIRAARGSLAALGLHRPIALHPGAGAVWKRWPVDRFAGLAGWLAGQGHEVLLIEGPADVEVVDRVREQAGQTLPVLRTPDLRLVGAVLTLCKGYIGNDSGPTHLAAMSGAPTVALFGPTDPVQWRPLGHVRVIRACRAMSTAAGAVRVCDDPRCMEGISVREVVQAIHEVGRISSPSDSPMP